MKDSAQQNRAPFIGPKALFDKNFIPAKVYGLKNMTEDLKGLLYDFAEDSLSCVTTISGNRGMGKKLLVRRTLNSLVSDKKLASRFLLLECEYKSAYSLLMEITEFLGVANRKRIKEDAILGITIEQLWSLIKHLSMRLEQNIVIMLDGAEYVDKKVLMKLIAVSKHRSKMHLILSFNVSGSNFKVIEMYEADKRITMPEYAHSDLFSITKDRAEQAVESGISSPVAAFVVDTVIEYGNKNPGSCIGFLKDLYPMIFERKEIRAEEARMQARYYFGMKMMDSISVADILMGSDMLERLVLDNVVQYFKNSDKLYIPFSKLAECYKTGCECLEGVPRKEEFVSIVERLSDNYILLPSPLFKSRCDRLGNIPISPYFLTMPADELSELLDACFDTFEDEFR